MKNTAIALAAIAAAALTPGPPAAKAGTLDDVKARGVLNCIVSTGLAGFSFTDKAGKWRGFDADFCRAVAAAVLGDGDKVKFIPATGKTRFTLLNSKEGDLIFRNTTWTFARDVDVKLTFTGTTYYDGQGFMIGKKLGVKSAKQLDGATVCIQTGTTTELNLADFFRANKIEYEPVPIETNEEARANYLAERCDAYTTDVSGLAATRATFDNPGEHTILPEIISKEPLSGVVRQGDDQWGDVVRWTVNAIVSAEEYGITQANADAKAKGTNNPNINRLLGSEGGLGAMLGLDKQWAARVIEAVGNYAEIFDRNIGPKTPIGLRRGLNAQWYDGGLLYAPPFR
ncbi:MAG: amino acid ABC transporter substrate-binding protein [Rhodospirillales bacterium]|jgi:general L-amino acid transport system substrate-binding protein|nr:amino acid ABC transporter substrate-binding protein [Rhodospirillales bacterium]MDP7214325.1 amino acid ABC transporter substrate-binding protein [Rhodospirillales bacterium]HJO74337.1 amino acid ABC transporter substrate-binding protein [Rhodospirillales bacterium]